MKSTMAGMHPLDPFDAIALDGDGDSTPHVDLDIVEEQRRAWAAVNAADVPTVTPAR